MMKSRKDWFDLSEESLWQGHDFAVAQVTEVEADGCGADWLTVHFTTRLTAMVGPPATQVIRAVALWPAHVITSAPPTYRPGDAFLLGLRKADGGVAYALQLDGGPTAAAALRQATQIAALRDDGQTATIAAAAFGDDPIVARYALKRLTKDASGGDPLALAGRLETFADAPAGDVENRILARELAGKLQGAGPDAPGLYDWLERTISGGGAADFAGLTRLMRRMAAFADRRTTTVGFLTGLVQRPSAGRDAKIAVYGTLSDPHLVNPARPDDAESKAIFDAYLTLLQDADAEIRAGAAGHLREICIKTTNPAARTARIHAATYAVTEAIRGINHEGWAGYLAQQLQMLGAA